MGKNNFSGGQNIAVSNYVPATKMFQLPTKIHVNLFMLMTP